MIVFLTTNPSDDKATTVFLTNAAPNNEKTYTMTTISAEELAKMKAEWRNRNKNKPKTLQYTGEPQFEFSKIYITPFTHRRTYSEEGKVSYVQLERNMNPTGFHIMDELCRYLTAGHSNINTFASRYGATMADIYSLIFLFTGMLGPDFCLTYHKKIADELLRYTDMSMPDIAKRCGIGTRVNLYYILKRDYGTSPKERRYNLRKKGDFGLYKIY